MHSYFGHEDWEPYAPGLKTIEQATEIRRRVLSAFERAEASDDPDQRRRLLTFVVVGGGPTGVELAGAIGEMSRFTLSRDFRNIDAKLARIILVEAGPRILPMFSETLASRATRDLESLGVQVWTDSLVSEIDDCGVDISGDRINASTVLWAAGVKASSLGTASGFLCDKAGRIKVGPDLSIPGHANIFVAGDQCWFASSQGPLPGVAPVAVQQGKFIADAIVNDIRGNPRGQFRYKDKGQMATIGRSRAITEIGQIPIHRSFRLDGLACRSHLFSERVSQSAVRCDQLGLVFSYISPWSTADFGQAMAVLREKLNVLNKHTTANSGADIRQTSRYDRY